MSENTRTVVERAREEAKRRWPCANQPPFGPDDYMDMGSHAGFDAGAAFAATVTPEQVEVMARDLYLEEANDSDGFDAWPEWESHDNPTRDIWRFRVRSMLLAAGFQIEADR